MFNSKYSIENIKNKNSNKNFIIKQCPNCNKVFGFIPKAEQQDFKYCESCEKELSFKSFVNDFNLLKK